MSWRAMADFWDYENKKARQWALWSGLTSAVTVSCLCYENRNSKPSDERVETGRGHDYRMSVKPWDERCSSVLLITRVHDCWLCGRESIESCQLVQGAGGLIEVLWRTLKLSYSQAALCDTRLSGSQLRHTPSALLFSILTEDLVNVQNPQIQGWEMGNGGGHRHRKWAFFASFSYSCFTPICNFTIMTSMCC